MRSRNSTKFRPSQPDDETLLGRDRDRLRRRLDPAARGQSPDATGLARTVIAILTAAQQRNSTHPERMPRFVEPLTKTSEEQD